MRYFICYKNNVPTRVDLLSITDLGNGMCECYDEYGKAYKIPESKIECDFD